MAIKKIVFILLTKGADSAVFERLRSDQNFERASADSHVDDYASVNEEEVVLAKAAIHKAERRNLTRPIRHGNAYEGITTTGT